MEQQDLVENKLSFSKIPRVGLHVRDLSITASKTDSVLVHPFHWTYRAGL